MTRTLRKQNSNLLKKVTLEDGQNEPSADAMNALLQDPYQRFELVLESLPEGIAIFNPSGELVYCNSPFERLTGYTRKEIQGKPIYQIFFPQGSVEQDTYFNEMLARYKARELGISETYISQIYRKDGSRRYVETKAGPLREANGEIIGSIGANFDVTERVLLEEQLRISQNIQTSESIANTVIQGFGDLLTTLHINVALLTEELSEEKLLSARLKQISETIDSASLLSKRLIQIGNLGSIDTATFDLSFIVREVEELLSATVGAERNIRYNLAADLPLILCDKSTVQRMLLNLIVYIHKLLRDKGAISVETKTVQILEPTSTPTGVLLPGMYVALSIEEDEGVLIREINQRMLSSQTQEKEVFSKKRVMESGLATTLTMIGKLCAGVQLESKNSSSRLTFFLPKADDPPLFKPSGDRKISLSTRSESVVVVESNSSLRSGLVETLRRAGCTVTGISDSVTAIDLIKEKKVIPDIMVIRMDMRPISGAELAEKVLSSIPNVKILLLESNPFRSKAQTDRGSRLLKPFNAKDLLSALGELIESKTRIRTRALVREDNG